MLWRRREAFLSITCTSRGRLRPLLLLLLLLSLRLIELWVRTLLRLGLGLRVVRV